MLNLLSKDFRLLFAGRGTRRNKIISYVFTAIIAAIFVALEVYIFQNILSKLLVYSSSTCLTFFNIFLFIIAIIMLIFTIGIAKRLFFNGADNQKLLPYPISSAARVTSKLLMLFLTSYALNFIVNYPLFIAYGIIMSKGAWFYYVALFYPVLVFFVEAGVAFIFLYPYKLIVDYLKKHLIVQFVAIVIVAFGLCIAYGYVLNLFVSLMSTSSLSSLFTRETLATMNTIGNRLFPTNYLVDIFVNASWSLILPYLGVSIGIFIIGLAVVIVFYNYFLRQDINKKTKQKEYVYHQNSPTWALIRKELLLLFRDSTFIISFTGLLIIEPLLTYYIVMGVNVIFTSSSLAYISFVIPNLIPVLDILLMMLTVVIIAQGSNNFIQSEDKNVRTMKTIPVPYSRQLIIKTSIPFVLSSVFMLLSFVVLAATGLINIISAFIGFFLCLALLLVVTYVSLIEQLNSKRNKASTHILSMVYSYLIPIVYFVVAVALCYAQVNIYITYLISLVIIVICAIPYLIRPRKRLKELFNSLEVAN